MTYAQTDFRAQIRRQIELEDEMRSLGVSRYNARQLPWRTEAGSADEEANLPPARMLMKTAIGAVTETVEAFLAEVCNGKAGRRHNAADFLLLTEPDEVAYLALRVLINATKGDTLLQGVALGVADALVDNLQFKGFEAINKKGYKAYMKQQEQRGYSRQRKAAVQKLFKNEGVDPITLGRSEALQVGSKCIELIVEATGFFVIEKQARAKGYAYVVRATETLQQWLDQQHARCALLDPVAMPMIVRPRRWKSPTYGGYLTPRYGNRFVKQRNRAYHDELRNMDIQQVYDSINFIQETRWQINRDILNVMDALWVSGGNLGGLPSLEDRPVPARPEAAEWDEEIKAEWKKAAAEVHAENAAQQAARLTLHQKLWVARKFQNDPVYFPHELDFRGRVYLNTAPLKAAETLSEMGS